MPVAQAIAWKRVIEVAHKWVHRPDILALRAILSAVKALDLETRPVWVMLLGASDSAKTAYYIQSCMGYPRIEVTDQTTAAGIRSAQQGNSWGHGILERLGDRGLWVFPDFTVILKMKDDRRDEVFGIQRRIYDGSYSRSAAGEVTSWKGRIHAIAACTPAIERYYHTHAELGQRFLQVRVDRVPPCDDLQRKIDMQAANWAQYQTEVLESGKALLESCNKSVVTPFAVSRRILDWSDFISMGRRVAYRNYKDEIVDVGAEEGCSRIGQQLQGMVQADALLQGQAQTGPPQLELVERVALDCLPWARRAILREMRTSEPIPLPDIQDMSGITHPYTFARTIDELEAIGAGIQEGAGSITPKKFRLLPRAANLLCP